MIKQCQRLGLSLMAGLITASAGSASALPGETAAAVESWMQSNPTLSPTVKRGLTVFRSDSPARRFTFQASLFPVAGLDLKGGALIRTEQLTLFDMVDGVDLNRLEESLRAIYGAEIYTDYQQAALLYFYPGPGTPPSANPDIVLQGEVWEGQRYAYWLELAANPEGLVYSGRLTVFLKEDLPLLRRQLTGES